MRILTAPQEALLKEERTLLNNLRVSLVAFDTEQADQETLGQSIRQLDELFLLVVVGEFNAGKSALINALLGERTLKEGVTPTTTQINVLRFGENAGRVVENDHLHILTAPVEMLTEISIVDTPGTNAIIREHETITSLFVPRADLVLFITSADRPFTESERAFLESIRNWGKKVIVVLNKIDLFQSEDELEQVKAFIAKNAQDLFGLVPEIFPVSSRLALRAKLGEPQYWSESRFESLETYIHNTLDESSRLRLKLLNPLGVGEHLAEKYIQIISQRLDMLQADVTMLGDVDEQLALYKEDMQRDFNFRMADIENVLLEMEKRGQDYFDETLRIGRVLDLLNKSRIQNEFEQRVVSDSPQQVESKVNELIDWLVDADLRQWQAVTEHLAERRRQHQERIVGDTVAGGFHHARERLIDAVGRSARQVVDTYDRVSEAEAIANGAQTAVAALAAVEVGAVGLGTLIAILATTATADATGILLASLMAALGFFVIPARRKRAKAEMRAKITEMRTELVTSLRKQFETEIDRSLRKIQETIAPYTRFVRAERGKLAEKQSDLLTLDTELSRIRVRVEEVTQN